MTVNRYLVPILAIVLLLGTVGVAELTGNWIVSGKELINVEQMTSSADIRGWMTLDQVATGLNIEIPVLYELAGIPAEIPPETALKDMEGLLPDFETSGVRDVVAVYLGEVEPEIAETAAEPEAVTAAVATTPEPTPAAVATPTEVHVPLNDGSGTGPTPPPPGTVLAAEEIKGRDTLRQVADYTQVPLDALLTALGLPSDTDPGQSIRDLVESGAITEVDDVRAAVTELQTTSGSTN